MHYVSLEETSKRLKMVSLACEYRKYYFIKKYKKDNEKKKAEEL